MKVLLINPPKYYWPFINEYDNFLLPQSLVCLAAVLRENGIEVKIIDCLPIKLGWKSLAERIREEKPDVVGVGENHALYINESVKLINLVKDISPRIITVAGGAHFTNLAPEYMQNKNIDFIVRGEGELIFLELLKKISLNKDNFEEIKGIAFRKNGNVVITPPSQLIDNLDSLPLPAYDLVPMDRYGNSRYLFSPGGTTVHHSRGCTSNCKFCVWWTQMAERRIVDGREVLLPRWRTKSVERMIEEIEVLYYQYNKKCLVFVDDSWNINPKWNNDFAESLLKSNLKLNWFAFMRADCILRDEKLGIFEKLVRSGLSHICIGVERAEDEELSNFRKSFYSKDLIRHVCKIIKKKYPSVFLQCTFIVGIQSETRESMFKQMEFARELGADFPAFHPITPVPGTKLWEEVKEKKLLEVTDFSKFDWMTPVMSSRYLSRQEIEDLLIDINQKFLTVRWLLKGLFSPYSYKRRMYIWWFLVLLKVIWEKFIIRLKIFNKKEIIGLQKPKWYDS